MLFILSLVITFFSQAEMNSPEIYQQFETALRDPKGVIIEVHGVDVQNNLFVVAFRPTTLFEEVIISMVPDYNSANFKSILGQLQGLRRHDFIRIKGETSPLVTSYQNHFLVSELTVLKKFTTPYDTGETYIHTTKVKDVVKGVNTLTVKVHASLLGGNVFMVEYGDANIPVVVPNVDLTKDLYRGDKISMDFDVKNIPGAPVHLDLRAAAGSVRVLDRIADIDNKPITRCGELVLYPQSPMIKFNVFALKHDIGDNLYRQYTLINFNDMVLFQGIREKAQKAWDTNSSTAVVGRDYFVNPKVKVCATGTGNMTVPSQANPQILIDKLEDLTFSVTP